MAKQDILVIDGEFSLDDIAQHIGSKEDMGWESTQSTTADYLGTEKRRVNVVQFNLRPGRSAPKELLLQDSGQSSPVSSEKIWEGEMIVEGHTKSVAAYRAT